MRRPSRRAWAPLTVTLWIAALAGCADRPGAGAPATEPAAQLENLTVTLPGTPGPVTLKAGQGTFAVAPGSAARGRVWLVEGMAARWQGRDRSDVSRVLAIAPGGSGTFYHLVLFDATGDHLVQRSQALLGDRIAVQRIGVGELVHDPEADYRISVVTLVRRDGEPMASPPTVPRTRTFYVTRQRLEEVDVGRDDT
jgi:hypothetical protein